MKGVPTVILFSPGGGEHQRMVGYVGPDEMLAAMRQVAEPGRFRLSARRPRASSRAQ